VVDMAILHVPVQSASARRRSSRLRWSA
jgi:hypothetical protein